MAIIIDTQTHGHPGHVGIYLLVRMDPNDSVIETNKQNNNDDYLYDYDSDDETNQDNVRSFPFIIDCKGRAETVSMDALKGERLLSIASRKTAASLVVTIMSQSVNFSGELSVGYIKLFHEVNSTYKITHYKQGVFQVLEDTI